MDYFLPLLALFAVVFAIFIAMHACVGKLARLLRERHPDKFDEVGLEDLRDWESRPRELTVPRSVLRFLLRRRFYKLRDDELVRLSYTMRWLFFAYASGFAVLFVSVTYLGLEAQFGPEGRAGAVAPAPAMATAHEDRRDPSYEQQARDGTQAESTFRRGNAKANLGQVDAALVDYRRVMDLDPAHFEAHRNADRILSRQLRWDDCIDVWNRYLRVVPRDPEGYYERAGSFYKKGDLDASRADLKRACELGKTQACARLETLGGTP